MIERAGWQVLLFVVLCAAPHFASAQAVGRLSVEPSDPGTLYGAGDPDTEFVITADVPGAQSYELSFDPEQSVDDPERDAEGRTVWRHVFGSPGTYTAILRAQTDGSEPPVELRLPVVVRRPPAIVEQPPAQARFSVEPFDPARSADSPGCSDIVTPWAGFEFVAYVTGAESYEFDFGDDQVERSIEPNSAGRAVRCHEYAAPGRYTAVMRAWSNTGELTENELVVRVQAPPPEPKLPAPPEPIERFEVDPRDPVSLIGQGDPGTDFYFRAEISDAVQYVLDYGDGNTIEGPMPPAADGKGFAFPVHRYGAPGTYTARLTAERASGETVALEQQVSVEKPPFNWWWLLLLAAIVLALGTFVGVAAGVGETITFSANSNALSARIKVVGSGKADDAVSMRVRRGAGRTVVRKHDGDKP